MKITSLDHITINCKDLEASIRFYEGLLGLEKSDVVDLGDHTLHYYKLPGLKTRLELINYNNEQKALSTGNTDVGIYRHVAFETDDLEGFYKTINEAGYKINLPPTMIPQIGKRIILIVDPNGVEIEFIQK